MYSHRLSGFGSLVSRTNSLYISHRASHALVSSVYHLVVAALQRPLKEREHSTLVFFLSHTISLKAINPVLEGLFPSRSTLLVIHIFIVHALFSLFVVCFFKFSGPHSSRSLATLLKTPSFLSFRDETKKICAPVQLDAQLVTMAILNNATHSQSLLPARHLLNEPQTLLHKRRSRENWVKRVS